MKLVINIKQMKIFNYKLYATNNEWNNPLEQFSYQNFSSHIRQIKYLSISSNTIFVLTNDNFNILGLNDNFNEITYHERIKISGKNIINFCIGNLKHLHDKLLHECNFYYGWSEFAAYFLDNNGDIYICSPIIPDNFQCTIDILDTLQIDIQSDNDNNYIDNILDENKEETYDDNDNNEEFNKYQTLYNLWIEQKWDIFTINNDNSNNNHNLNESILVNQYNQNNEITQQYVKHDSKIQFIYENKAIYRGIYKLNICDNNNNNDNNNNLC